MKQRRRTPSYSRFQLDFQRLEPRHLLATLANGQEIQSSVAVNATQSFDLQANSGDVIDISIGEVINSNVHSPRLTLFGPNGVEIATDSNSLSAQIEFTALQSGTYTAVVEEDGRNRSMDFRIRALTLPGTPQLIEGRDNVLENGEEAVASIPFSMFIQSKYKLELLLISPLAELAVQHKD